MTPPKRSKMDPFGNLGGVLGPLWEPKGAWEAPKVPQGLNPDVFLVPKRTNTSKYVQIGLKTPKNVKIRPNTSKNYQKRTNTSKTSEYLQIRQITFKSVRIRPNTYKYVQIYSQIRQRKHPSTPKYIQLHVNTLRFDYRPFPP